MQKWLKWLLITFGALVVLLVAAVIIIPMVVDPNDYKPQISEAVYEATGRRLDIKGDIELSLFPWIGAEVGEVSLSNAEGFGEAPMVSVRQTDVRVKVIPLLSRQVEMKKIVLKGVEANLARNENGRTNWDDLTAGKAEEAVEEDAPQAEERDDPAQTLNKLRIEGLELTDTTLTWDDRQAGTFYRISELDLTITPLRLDAPADIDMSCDIESRKPSLKASLKLTTELATDLNKTLATLNGLDLDLNIERFAPTPDKPEQTISGTITLSAAKAQTNWQNGTAEASGFKLDTDLTGKEMPSARLSLASDATADWKQGWASLPNLTLSAEAGGESIPGGKISADLQAATKTNWTRQTAELKNMKLSALGVDVSGELAVDGFEKPNIGTTLSIAPFSLKELLGALDMKPIETRDPKALTRVRADISLKATMDSVDVTSLSAGIDETTLTGTANVANFAKPAIAFDLKADRMNVDRYLPPKSPDSGEKDKKPEQEKKGPKGEEKTTDVVEELKKLNIDGRLRIGSLTVYKIESNDVTVRVLAKNGDIRIDPFSARIFGGMIAMNLASDLSRKTAPSSLKLGINDLGLEPLLKAFMNSAPAGGATDLKLDVASRGLSVKSLLRHLDGTASLAIKNGFIKGFRLEPERFDTKKGYVPAKGETKITEFRTISSSFNIKDGIARTSNLVLKTNLHEVVGSGSADLADRMLDTRFKADLGVMVVPVKITGPFTSPDVSVDTAGMITEGAKKLMETPGKILEKPGDMGKKVLEGIGEGAKGVFDMFGGDKKK